MQLHVEGLEALQHGQADAAGGHGAHGHALDIVGAGHAIGDVPAAFHDPVVGRDVVAHEAEDHHHDMFGNADAIAVGHLGDGDAAIHGGLEIDMVRADAGGDGELELRSFGDALGRDVGGPKWLRNHDVGIDEFLVERAAFAVLVGCDDQRVSLGLKVLAQAEFARNAAEQGAGLEVNRLGGGQGLTVGIFLEFWEVIPCVGAWISGDGIIIKDADNFSHGVIVVIVSCVR